MPTFYTNSGSLRSLEVSGSALISGSSERLVRIIGTGSAILSISASTGPILEVSEFAPAGSNKMLVFTSGSVDVFSIERYANVTITGSLVVSGSNGAGIFSQGATLVDYGSGISNSGSYAVWRAPFSCSVVAIYGYREGGGPSKVNAARDGNSGYGLHASSDISLTSANTWTAFGSLQNTNYNTGDTLKLIMSGSASNNQLAVQVDFIRRHART